MLSVQVAASTILFLDGQGGLAASAAVLAGSTAGYAAGIWLLRRRAAIEGQWKWWLPLLMLVLVATVMLITPYNPAATGAACILLLALAYIV